MPWVTSSAGVEEWMPAPHEPTAAPDLRAQIAATRAKVQIDAQLAAAAPTRPLTLAEQIAATRAKVAGGGNTATAGDLAETCTLAPTLPPPPPPRPLSLAEQIAATRAKAVSASLPEETPEEARERRVRAKEAREAAERAELEAELRAEEEARRQAELESEAEVAAFLEAEEKAAAQAVAAAAHGAETAADLAEPDLPFKPTLAQQIAATRAKLAREECARHDAEATAAADASMVSTRSAPDVAPKLPSGFKSADELAKPLEVPAQFRVAVEAGRVDELYSLLQVADVSLRASPGFKDLKKQLLAEAKQIADRRAVERERSSCGS